MRRVYSPEYVAPIALKAVVIALCGGAGAGIAWAFGAGLGEHSPLKLTGLNIWPWVIFCSGFGLRVWRCPL